MLFTIGRESKKGFYFTQVSVFGDSCKGGEGIKPKAKGPHYHQIFENLS
jgi:hypothetical protein